jgi:hypothetical protein
MRPATFESGRPAISKHSVIVSEVLLCKGDVYRVPETSQEIRVKSGSAWISWDGEDIVLGRGESLSLLPRKDAAVVSAVGHWPLVLEVPVR